MLTILLQPYSAVVGVNLKSTGDGGGAGGSSMSSEREVRLRCSNAASTLRTRENVLRSDKGSHLFRAGDDEAIVADSFGR